MTAIQRIQVNAALNQLEVADKWLGVVDVEQTRRSLGIIRTNLQTALAGSSLNMPIADVKEMTDAELESIFNHGE